MAAPIQVPVGFREEFNFYCDRAGIVGQEREWIRNQVRVDFDTVGKWVQESAALYRFIDVTWFGEMPTSDLCQGYLESKGLFYEDEALFKRLGILLQVKMCARAATALPV